MLGLTIIGTNLSKSHTIHVYSLYTNSYVCNQVGRLDRHMTHSIMCNSSKILGMLNISMHGSFFETASSKV